MDFEQPQDSKHPKNPYPERQKGEKKVFNPSKHEKDHHHDDADGIKKGFNITPLQKIDILKVHDRSAGCGGGDFFQIMDKILIWFSFPHIHRRLHFDQNLSAFGKVTFLKLRRQVTD